MTTSCTEQKRPEALAVSNAKERSVHCELFLPDAMSKGMRDDRSDTGEPTAMMKVSERIRNDASPCSRL